MSWDNKNSLQLTSCWWTALTFACIRSTSSAPTTYHVVSDVTLHHTTTRTPRAVVATTLRCTRLSGTHSWVSLVPSSSYNIMRIGHNLLTIPHLLTCIIAVISMVMAHASGTRCENRPKRSGSAAWASSAISLCRHRASTTYHEVWRHIASC